VARGLEVGVDVEHPGRDAPVEVTRSWFAAAELASLERLAASGWRFRSIGSGSSCSRAARRASKWTPRSATTPLAGNSFNARPPKSISPRFASNDTRAAKLP